MSTDSPFPVDSYRDAAAHTRRPFTSAAVKFKVQSLTKDGSKALIVAYIDARLVVERLNLICPHLWHDAYEPVGGGKGLVCHLTVDGITRRDVGEGVGKALFSDALKRAAVKFGVGVSLYAVPRTWLPVDGKHVKAAGKNAYMQDAGEQACRDAYTRWLNDAGIRAFGEPLDHGDVEGAQGDTEADSEQVAEPSMGGNVEDKPLTPTARAKIAAAIDAAGYDVEMILAAAGFDSLADVGTVGAAVKVRAELDRLAVAS